MWAGVGDRPPIGAATHMQHDRQLVLTRQLQLCAPDSVIGTRFGEVISGHRAGFVLARNELPEDLAGAIQYLRVERALKGLLGLGELTEGGEAATQVGLHVHPPALVVRAQPVRDVRGTR